MISNIVYYGLGVKKTLQTWMEQQWCHQKKKGDDF
jgi:hypothetical protein